jgi:tetratricopeptide (TPR) repeat protein
MTIDPRLELMSVTLNLNNEGARHLKKGDHEAAISAFSRGLYACRDLTISGYSNPSNEKHCQEYHNEFSGLDSIMDMSDGNNMDLVEHDQPYVYLHPLTIPASVSKVPSEAISAIFIFNLALAHHQYGAKKSKKALLKALKLYECALAYAVAEDSYWAPQAYFILTCINNLALVHRSLGELQTSDCCFQRVLSMLMFLVVTTYDCDFNMDGFFRNVTYLIFSNGPSPPAATA